MSYATSHEVWKNLGTDAYTKVREETVGTGDASTTIFDFDQDNLISGSETIYTGGTAITSGYSMNLDDGKVTFTVAPTSGSVITSDYDYADIPDSWMTTILSQANEELSASTGRIFSSTSVTDEYHDVAKNQVLFYLDNYPAITVSSVQHNTKSLTDTPSWSTSTEGLGNDYIYDAEESRIRFIDNFPLKGERRLKVDYISGYSTVPALVKELEILLATRKMINSAVYKSIIKGRDSFTPIRLEEIESRINELTKMLGKQNIQSI